MTTKRSQRGDDTKLADEYFGAVWQADRLEKMLDQKVVDIVGGVAEDQVDYFPEERVVIFQYAPNSFAIKEEQQNQLYALGFLRIWIYHQNGLQTSYYWTGDPKGKTTDRVYKTSSAPLGRIM